jgi:tetratricopeptide (TPR) repeat protein
MQPGDVIADRFEIGRPVGAGAMGIVFLARDHATRTDVAVKVLRDAQGRADPRFEREAAALAELHHPHVVRYIAHGTTPHDEPYLVMEWIEGEDLGRRLSRGRLRVDACLTLAARVAAALAEAHARGVVHRDVKPSNLFLPGGAVEQVKVLDFGIARLAGVARATQTGAVLGTPGYLPPEQARGDDVIDPRADMFSLGCVLFECLTGAPAFAGQHLPAILAKILFEPAPSARALCPEVPDVLESLIARMLAKDPAQRPTSAAVAATLASLEQLAAAELGGQAPSSAPPISVALTSDEQRVLSAVMIAAPPPPSPDTPEVVEPLRRIAEAHGARLERMADGSMAAIPREALPPIDEAAQAARLALDLHAALPGRPVVMATGRSGGLFKRTVGDAINRAVRLLDERSRRGTPADAVLVDEASARLLDQRFQLRPASPGFAVVGELDPNALEHTLLGQASPYVGRKAELGMLASLLAECVEESVARAVVVIGPNGFGKSRLLHEFLRGARRESPRAAVWTARGDALRAGAVFGILAQSLRSAVGLRGGEPIEVARERLSARVAERVPAAARARVAEFLGELLGAPFPDEGSAQLWAARTDARLMREQMLRAWADFLRAECAARPVVLAVDDLQWGDAPSIRCVGRALAALKDAPFFVLALGRPEVAQVFPKLWEEQGVVNLRLKELSRKAGAELVTRALGGLSTPALVERLVTQADGHARYLEELIRAVAAGHEATAPETVLALVDARLSQLPAEARRVLRAASIFGDVAWSGGVAALVPDAEGGVGRHLDALVKHEVLALRPESRFPGEVEVAFRHALLREGAYAMLTDTDRALGHRLAAEWLEQRGEADPVVLAAHFERAGEGERAGRAYARAAEQAYHAGDSDAAIRHARRGLGFELPGEIRGAILGVLCEAYVWRFEWDVAASIIEEALQLARPGSVPWVHVMTARIWLSVARGEFDVPPAELAAIRAAAVEPEAVGQLAFSLCVGVFVLDMLGRFEAAAHTLAGLAQVVDPVAAHDFRARGWLDLARAHFAVIAEDDPWRGLGLSRAAVAGFQDAGCARGLPIALLVVGTCLGRLGSYEEAERTLRSAVVDWDLGDFALLRDYYLVRALLDRGEIDAAHEAAVVLVERSREVQIARYEGRGHGLLAEIHARAGDLDAADREIRLALAQLPEPLLHRLPVLVTHASIRLAQGRAEEALRLAGEACAACDALGAYQIPARLALAEALEAGGAPDRAREALVEARAILLAKAEKIGAPALQRSFVERVPEHARVAHLAHAWRLIQDAAPTVRDRPDPDRARGAARQHDLDSTHEPRPGARQEP